MYCKTSSQAQNLLSAKEFIGICGFVSSCSSQKDKGLGGLFLLETNNNPLSETSFWRD
jgi:hypothetical protein